MGQQNRLTNPELEARVKDLEDKYHAWVPVTQSAWEQVNQLLEEVNKVNILEGQVVSLTALVTNLMIDVETLRTQREEEQ